MQPIHGDDIAGIAFRARGVTLSVASAEDVYDVDQLSVSASNSRYLATMDAPEPGYSIRHRRAGDCNVGNRAEWVIRVAAVACSIQPARPEEVLGRSAAFSGDLSGRPEPEAEAVGDEVVLRRIAEDVVATEVSFDRVRSEVEAVGGEVVLRRFAENVIATEVSIDRVRSEPEAVGDDFVLRRIAEDVVSTELGEDNIAGDVSCFLRQRLPDDVADEHLVGALLERAGEVRKHTPACVGTATPAFIGMEFGLAGEEAQNRIRRWRPDDDAKATFCFGHHEWAARRRCARASASTDHKRECGHIRAPLDIFIARERPDGVAPSWLDTARTLGIRYWINTLKEWTLARLGFASPMPKIPMAWSWLSGTSPPVFQTGGHDGRGDGSCVICSSVMCIHAQHCLAFERLYGPGSFPYELTDIDYLKSASQSAGVWSPITGSYPADMLDFIKVAFPGGLRCREVPGWRACSLPLKAHTTFSRKELEPIAAMFMIRYCGPMIGTLYAGKLYTFGNWNPNYIYRGDSASDTADHAVLCVAYRITKKRELLIHVLDNQRPHGPLRWISYRAFMEFTCVQVDALSMDKLRIQPRSLLQRMLSWVIPRI